MIPGETIATGAPATCEDCKVTPELKVYVSPAGFYIGTFCQCGPYSRESGYYDNLCDAEKALKTGGFGR